MLAGVAVIAFAADHYAPQLTAQGKTRTQVLEAVTSYAGTVAWCTAGLAALLAVVAAITRQRRQHGKQLRMTVARALSLHPDLIRARERRSHGWLTAATIQVPPQHGLPTNPVKKVTDALAPLAAGPIDVTYNPGRGQFQVELSPPEVVRHWWDDEHPILGQIHAQLDQPGLLPGATIDQAGTSLADLDHGDATIRIRYNATTKDAGPRFQRRIRDILNAKAPSPTGAWAPVWLPHEHMLVLRPGVPLPELALIPAPKTEQLPPVSIPLGVLVGEHEALWRATKSPHLLIAGETGGGKSVLIRSLLVSGLILGWDTYLIDAKRLGYRQGFATGWGLSHDRIATTGDAMEDMILAVEEEAQRRNKLCEWGLAKPSDFPPLVLISDENTETVKEVNEAARRRALAQDQKPPRQSPAVDAMWTIARIGREVRVYLVLAHQRADVTYIPGEARDNMKTVVAAGPVSPESAKMLFGKYTIDQRVTVPHIGADGQIGERAVKGRCTVSLGYGEVPMQGYWTPKPELVDMSEDELAEMHKRDPDDTVLTPDENTLPAAAVRRRIQELRTLALQVQQRASHQLLPGIRHIDPAAEKAEIEAEEARRQQAANVAPGGGDEDQATTTSAQAGSTQDPTGPRHAGGGAPPDDVPPATSASQVDQVDPPATSQVADNHQPTLLDRAADVVTAAGQASTAQLKRELRVGHAKAAELMGQLEERGIIGPAAGSRPRPVLVDSPSSATNEQVPTQRHESVRVNDLDDGDTVLLEIDDEQPVEVEIYGLVESTDGPDLVDIDYRVADPDHPGYGEEGSITLDEHHTVRRI